MCRDEIIFYFELFTFNSQQWNCTSNGAVYETQPVTLSRWWRSRILAMGSGKTEFVFLPILRRYSGLAQLTIHWYKCFCDVSCIHSDISFLHKSICSVKGRERGEKYVRRWVDYRLMVCCARISWIHWNLVAQHVGINMQHRYRRHRLK